MKLSLRASAPTAVSILELGVAHLTAAKVERRADGRWHPRGAFERRWLATEGEPGAELDAALSALRAAWGAGGPVQVVLPSHFVLTRVLTVPAMAAAQRNRVVAFEAKQAIPFPLEEVVWDHTVLEERADGLRVLLVAAKRDILMSWLERVQRAGFEPVAVVPASLALTRAWEQFGGRPEPTVLLSVGARSTQLLGGAAGAWQLRTVAVGGSMVSRGIAERLQQDPAEAERLKLQVLTGQVDLPADAPAAVAVHEAVAGFCRRLVAEVQRSLVMMQRDAALPADATLQLCGAAAAVPGLAESLAERLGKTIEVWQVPDTDPALAGRVEWWGGAALALAEGPSLNLLPRSMAAARTARRSRPRWALAAGLTIVALALPGVQAQRLASARLAAAKQLSRQVGPTQALQLQIQDDVVAVEALREQVREVEQLLVARGAWTTFLADLQTRLAEVDDTWLERLQVLPATNVNNASAAEPAPARLRLSGRLLDRENPLSRVSPKTYEKATALLQELVESSFVSALEGERFDATDPGILRFDFTLVLNPAQAL